MGAGMAGLAVPWGDWTSTRHASDTESKQPAKTGRAQRISSIRQRPTTQYTRHKEHVVCSLQNSVFSHMSIAGLPRACLPC
jgi:hypothetical protein